MYSSLDPSLNKGKNMTLKPLVPNDSNSYQRILHFYTCWITPCSLFLTSMWQYRQYTTKFHFNFDFGLIFSRSGSQTRG